MIRCKRAYSQPSPDDGERVLVDRLWPRNCPKKSLLLADWLPAAAPSSELRRRFKRHELDFAAFRLRYRNELAAQPGHWWRLLELAQKGPLTLIYSARDPLHNNAVVLAEWLEDELDRTAEHSSPTCYLNEFPEL
ncbi:DUF488 domain-containing protein [Pseudomonas borbori]